MASRALITGGAGFLGSHLTRRLLADGVKVTAIDNFVSGKHENIEPFFGPNYRFIEGNVTDVLPEIFEPVDVVFNTAAIARTLWTVEDPVLSHHMTTTATLAALIWARDSGVRRFVHSSSCIIYVPNTPYFVAKQASEEYTRIFSSLYGLSTIALRYSNIYGKGQSESEPSPNVFAALRKAKKEHGCLFITGDGQQTRDYTHVDDIVEANILAWKSDVQGSYYVGTGIPTSLNEVAPYFGCPVQYVEERTGDVKHLVRDPSEFREKFGWKPRVKIHDGIEDVL